MKFFLPTMVLAVLLSGTDLVGKTLIFPPAAVDDLSTLGPARIELRWRPRTIPDGTLPVVEGYYVVYNHENLTLFFGPISNEQGATRTQNGLIRIRGDLIRKNPALSTSVVGIIKIDFGEEAENDLEASDILKVRSQGTGQAQENSETGETPREGQPPPPPNPPISQENGQENPRQTENASSTGEEPEEDQSNANSGESREGGFPARNQTEQNTGEKENPGPTEAASASDGTKNGLEESGLLNVLSQGTGPSQENSEGEEGEETREGGLPARNQSEVASPSNGDSEQKEGDETTEGELQEGETAKSRERGLPGRESKNQELSQADNRKGEEKAEGNSRLPPVAENNEGEEESRTLSLGELTEDNFDKDRVPEPARPGNPLEGSQGKSEGTGPPATSTAEGPGSSESGSETEGDSPSSEGGADKTTERLEGNNGEGEGPGEAGLPVPPARPGQESESSEGEDGTEESSEAPAFQSILDGSGEASSRERGLPVPPSPREGAPPPGETPGRELEESKNLEDALTAAAINQLLQSQTGAPSEGTPTTEPPPTLENPNQAFQEAPEGAETSTSSTGEAIETSELGGLPARETLGSEANPEEGSSQEMEAFQEEPMENSSEGFEGENDSEEEASEERGGSGGNWSSQKSKGGEEAEGGGSGSTGVFLGQLSEDNINREKMEASLETERELEKTKEENLKKVVKQASDSKGHTYSATGLELNQPEIFPTDI